MNNVGREIVFINQQNSAVNTTTEGQQQIQLQLPQSVTFDNGWELCLGNLFIYNSARNITTAFNNKTFSYTFNGSTFNITMPDGYYDVAGILAYLQQQMMVNGTYLIYTANSVATNVFYINFVANSYYYCVTFNFTPLPATIGSGYSTPSNWPFGSTTTTNGETPQIITDASNFNVLLGLSPSTSYPSTPASTTYNYNGGVGQISPIVNVSLNCNWVSTSDMSGALMTNSIFQFSILGVQYGEQYVYSPYQYDWFPITPGTYTMMNIWFTEQNGDNWMFLDPALSITLKIRRRPKINLD